MICVTVLEHCGASGRLIDFVWCGGGLEHCGALGLGSLGDFVWCGGDLEHCGASAEGEWGFSFKRCKHFLFDGKFCESWSRADVNNRNDDNQNTGKSMRQRQTTTTTMRQRRPGDKTRPPRRNNAEQIVWRMGLGIWSSADWFVFKFLCTLWCVYTLHAALWLRKIHSFSSVPPSLC